jgi:hypothetical protein
MKCCVQNTDNPSRSRTAFEQDRTLIPVIEMSLSSRLAAGMAPGWPGVLCEDGARPCIAVGS